VKKGEQQSLHLEVGLAGREEGGLRKRMKDLINKNSYGGEQGKESVTMEGRVGLSLQEGVSIFWGEKNGQTTREDSIEGGWIKKSKRIPFS